MDVKKEKKVNNVLFLHVTVGTMSPGFLTKPFYLTTWSNNKHTVSLLKHPKITLLEHARHFSSSMLMVMNQ